jgi:sigma-E factor negative regulatory protein RseB
MQRLLRATVLVCALSVASAALQAAPDDAGLREARALLQRMNAALAQRNYIGTLRHQRDGRSESLRILHRVKGNEVAERLVPLDGSRREFIRRGPELITLLPDQGVALVERRPRAGGLFPTLPQLDDRSAQLYTVAAVRSVRQQGREARLVVLEPRDGYRYGYRIWVDARTAMPLKTELRDERGTVLEEVAFTELRLLADIPDSDFRPAVPTAGLRWYRSAPVPVAAAPRAAAPAWTAGRLPPGFRLTQSTRQNLPGVDGPVEHLVFSDGIASVSVFIGARDGAVPKAAPVAAQAGGAATTFFVTRVEGRPVTVVGEVPMRTARFIALQVRPAAPSSPASPAAPATTAAPAAAAAPAAPGVPAPAAASAPPR